MNREDDKDPVIALREAFTAAKQELAALSAGVARERLDSRKRRCARSKRDRPRLEQWRRPFLFRTKQGASLMGRAITLRDFMIIARSGAADGEFHPRVREALLQAAASLPDVEPRADFDVGPREHVEVFSAPDIASARQVADAVAALRGVKSELAPLRNGW